MKAEKMIFPGKLGIQQRVLPAYRSVFFDAMAESCNSGLSVFAGSVHVSESIQSTDQLKIAEFYPGYNRHFSNSGSPYYFLWQGGLIDWLEDWNPDALVVEANPRYLSTRRAVQWMHRRGRPVIGWGLGAPPIAERSSFFSRMASKWQRSSRAKFLGQMDALIAYSNRGGMEYKAVSLPSQQIFVATNAVARRPSDKLEKRTAHSHSRLNLLFVGRLQQRKRIDNLLLACSKLPSNSQPFLRIIGDGPARNGFQELARTVYPSAEFPGAIHGSELDQYFAEADLFVLPGTGGLAVQEAMTHGLPVIVAKGDGTQEDLVKPSNGWLIPADDELALQEALKDAISDPQRLREMGANSYRIVRDEINVDQMVNVFVEAISSVTQMEPDSP
jgi:glycosyltransferase involved in cell wall biosynthesis